MAILWQIAECPRDGHIWLLGTELGSKNSFAEASRVRHEHVTRIARINTQVF